MFLPKYMPQKFAIIDIETTGGRASYDKITEFAAIIIQDQQIIQSYSTLIDPERSVPLEITRLTGITNDMVKEAPRFYEVAKDIILLLQDCIFVAHNVMFDYSFVKEEFARLGFPFSMKKLCTVQLSKKFFPQLKTYNLDRLIKHFNIEVLHRHRAYDDALATVRIFIEILKANPYGENLNKNLKSLISESKLPAGLSLEELKLMPEECGVYFMKTEDERIVYIGKSVNIKERIIQHFNDTGSKTTKLLHSVHHIDFQLTGSELLACLLEAQYIREYSPEANRALRKQNRKFAIYAETLPNGLKQLTCKQIEWLKPQDYEQVLTFIATKRGGQMYINNLIEKHELCSEPFQGSKLFNKPCNAYQIGKCKGVCIGKESIEEYLLRFNQLMNEINTIFKSDFLLTDVGRTEDEQALILVKDGYCQGTALLNKDIQIQDTETLMDYLEPYYGSIETNKIIQLFVQKKKYLSLKKIS